MTEDDLKKWHAAIRDNDTVTVASFVQGGVDVNEPIEETTPLGLAAIFGRTEAAAALLKAGAGVDQPYKPNHETPLLAAARGGSVAIVELLLQQGADACYCGKLGDALTQIAVRGDKPAHLQVVDRLLQAGANPGMTTTGRSILAPAARNKRLKGLITRLAAAGAEVNHIDPLWAATALHLAIDADNEATAAELLAAGADPKVKAPPSKAAWSEFTPLEYAERSKKKKLLALLQNAKASSAKSPKAANAKAGAQPARPGTRLSIGAAWKQIEERLSKHDAKMLKSLQAGVGTEECERLETLLGAKLPADVVQFFAEHNGQKKSHALVPAVDGSTEPYRLLPINEIVREWKVMSELVEGGDFDDQEASPDDGVRPVWWDVKWLPIASNGLGDLLCVDLSPPKGGTKTQVITFFHEHGQRQRLANSLKEWLATLAGEIVPE